MTAEAEIQTRIRLALGQRPDVRVFRNTVGEAWIGKAVHQGGGQFVVVHPRRVAFGLHPGSSDLIGWRTVTVTPDMIGRPLAVFLAIEVKAPRGRATAEQEQFITVVRRAGGIAGIVRDEDEAAALIKGVR